MIDDLVRTQSHLFLGTRLKRLGERMQADVLRVIEQAGLPVQPGQYPILAALDHHGRLSVGELVEAIGVSQPGVTRNLSRLVIEGLVQAAPTGEDRRRKVVELTDQGRDLVARSRERVWPFVEAAVRDLCAPLQGSLPDQLDQIEDALSHRSLDRRAMGGQSSPALRILPFTDARAAAFHDINAQWIRAMFTMEATDLEVLENPRRRIIEPGGDILFVEADGLGIVGACALQKTGERQFELTKMGVLETARGRKAGEFLLEAVIARAAELGAETLYLLTNARCQAAIHLYEKAGFAHDADIMARFGARYERCDVAMRHRPPMESGGDTA